MKLLILATLLLTSFNTIAQDTTAQDWQRRAAIAQALANIVNKPAQQPVYQYNQPQQRRQPANSLQNNQYYQQLQMQNQMNQMNRYQYGN